MKKILQLLCALIFLFAFNVSASHLMGGQITVAQQSGMNYQITMQLYRDMTGIPISPTATFIVEEVGGSNNQTIVANVTGPTPHLNNVEMYEYSAFVSFTVPGLYRIHWEECCRNAAILNMASAGAEALYLMTEITVDAAMTNSTPVFLNSPATLAQKNSPWQYNPLPFDTDGDSLAWFLETPLGATGAVVSGYTLPHADPSGPFTLNSLTGEITWLPDSNGHWESSLRVEEYRAGVKIGEIRRDMQIIVVDDTTNYHPVVFNNGSWPVDAQGNFAMNLNPGTPFNLSVIVSDMDLDNLTLSVLGEPMIASPAAQWSVINSMPGYLSGTFSWTPALAQGRTHPYAIALRCQEAHNQNVFTIDESILFYVAQNVGTENLSVNNYERKLFPNPSNGNWNLSFKLSNSSDVKIEITDLLGKKIATVLDANLPSGVNMISYAGEKLPAGYYLVNVFVDNAKGFSVPLTIK